MNKYLINPIDNNNYYNIADSHNDFLTKLNKNQIKNYYKSLIINNVKIINASIFLSELYCDDYINKIKTLVSNIPNYKNNLITNKNIFKLQDTKKYINKNNINNFKNKYSNIKQFTYKKNIRYVQKPNNKKLNTCTLLHIEDLFFITKQNVDDLIKIHPFSCSLTWNEQNALAGGINSKIGITKLGKYITKKLEEHKIIIDTAHLNKKSFYDLAKITKFPLYCSHTGIYSNKKSVRNLTEKQFKMIINSGGFIGIFFVKNYIDYKNNFTSFDIAKLIVNFCNKYGYNNIGLGTDFYGTTNLPNDLKNYEDMNNLIINLKLLKISNTNINKILYDNYYNFLKRINNLYNNKHNG